MEYNVNYGDVLGIRAQQVIQTAEALSKFLIRKDKRAFGMCKELAELTCAIDRFRTEEKRRIENSVHFVTKIRILRERRISVNVQGEKRPWLLCVGDTATVTNFGKNCYVAQAEDGSAAQYNLLFNKEGEEYETFKTPANSN